MDEGMYIVGHEIAASWVLKPLVKLRMARERERRGREKPDVSIG